MFLSKIKSPLTIMMKNGCLFCFLLFGTLLTSCNQTTPEKVLYYPMDSLVRAQAYYLSEARAVLNKQAEINGQEESNSFTPNDTTAWLHELDIFTELKTINKPINRGSYQVENGVPDTRSNLLIRSYTTTKDLPVAYLKIFYFESPSKIKKIEALFREENTLLVGSRLLVMEFNEVYNKTVLASYSIEGGQKMFLGDSVQFSVKGTITLP
jgi:hypothetical protein